MMNKNLKIILVSGKAGSGKTTYAEYLQRAFLKLDQEYLIQSFATPLKQFATELGWEGIKDDKGRQLLQQIGDAGRNYNEDVWAEKLVRQLKDCPFDGVIIDDWRYPNEERVIEEHFPTVVTVEIKRENKILSDTAEKHSSENSLNNCPATLKIYSEDLSHLEVAAGASVKYIETHFEKKKENY